MAQSDDAGISPTTSTAVADVFPTHNVGKPEVREMPAEPKQYWRLIGPGIIAAGVGLASGEFILYPYIASQVGLVFVWAALVAWRRSSSSTWRSSVTRWPPGRPP
jgi:hypothetical protein